MVLQFGERPQPTYSSTLAWVGRGALTHYKYQGYALAGVAGLSWPAVVAAVAFHGWLQYAWLALLAWGLLVGIQGANFLRKYTVSLDWDGVSNDGTRRGRVQADRRGPSWLYVITVFGVLGFLVCTLVAGELAGRLFGPAGMLGGVVAVQVLEGVLNTQDRSLAQPGITFAERLLMALQDTSAHQRQLLSTITDDLGGLFADGILGFWRVA